MCEFRRFGLRPLYTLYSIGSIMKGCMFPLCRHTLLLGVGRVLMLTTLTGVAVPVEHVKRIEDVIQKFLEIANVKGMRALQERHSNNWNSLIPIIEPILTPEQIKKVKKLFYFSLTVELPRKRLIQVTR